MNEFEVTLPVFDEELNMLPNDRYKEILVLDKMLTEAGIPHETVRFLDGWNVGYPNLGEDRVMDAIEHFGSYGHKLDRLEIMWGGQVLCHLSAQEVFESIKKHYDEVKNQKGK